MKRVLLSATLLLAIGAFVVLATGAANENNKQGEYKIELDNAFGLTKGAPIKIAGVPTGSITKIEVCRIDTSAKCQNPLHAVVTVTIGQRGYTQLRSDAQCRTRPESLIGEYFLDCEPGSTGQLLTPGSGNPDCNSYICTLPVTHTQSTIPFDLINNIMRMPYRERLTLIINELGAAVAGRSGDLQAALQRAVPALTDTDNLLNLLANDTDTLKALTANSDQYITALANNSTDVQNFIVQANNAATDTATQQNNLRLTLQDLPGFLEQLRPAMAKLSNTVVANTPVLQNLNTATGHNGSTTTGIDQLRRLFADTPPFAHASIPALQALGQASLTGKPAVQAAEPLVHHLNQLTGPTGCQTQDQLANQRGSYNPTTGATTGQLTGCLPELATNVSILTRDLDQQSPSAVGPGAVEADSRSPGGKGFTGLQALLQYAFNQPLAINSYSNYGHLLDVDAFIDSRCSPYATPQRIANNLATDPTARNCYAWLGPNQPGINERDPSNPGACVPDPGGAPPGERGPTGPNADVCKLQPKPSGSVTSTPLPIAADTGGGGTGSAATTTPSPSGSSGIDLQQTLGRIFSSLAGAASSAPSTATTSPAPSTGGDTSAGQAEQLLNYLLAP